MDLDANHELMPDAQDFLDADPDPTEEYIRDLVRKGRHLLEMARDNPFTEHGDLIAGRVTLGAYMEMYVIEDDRAEEVWIRVRATPDHHGSDIVLDVLQHVIPEARREDIHFPDDHPGRPLESGERVIRWACP